jgi:type IV secretion system protein VirD4
VSQDHELRRTELDRRASAWRRDLNDTASLRKLQFERQKQDYKRDIDRWEGAAKQKISDEERDAVQSIKDAEGAAGTGSSAAGRSKQYENMDDMLLTAAVWVAGALALLTVFVLAAGHISAFAYDGSVPRYEMKDVPGILQRLVSNLGDPGAAWAPVNSGGEVPGPLGWYAIFGLLLLLAVAVGFLLFAVRSTRPQTQAQAGSSNVHWSKASAHPWMRVQGNEKARLVVGTSGRSKLALGPLHSLLVVGPAHAGKTSGLAVPALLEWPGPAVVASTKSHLMDETIGWRSHQGEVHVFDPSAVTRYHRSGWSLLSDCGTWQGAIRMAQHLTTAAQALPGVRFEAPGGAVLGAGGAPSAGPAGPGVTAGVGVTALEPMRSQLWTSAMAMALAPFLYAAAAEGRTIMQAARWIEREERDEVLAILKKVDQGAAHAHEATFFREDASRSSFFHLMYQVLSVYNDPTVAETSSKHEIVAEELLDGGHNTLYLTAPEHDQARFGPLFATIVRQMLTAVNDRYAAEGTPLDPPLLLLLDEAVGITSVEDLAIIASTGGAKGVQVVSIFQDMGRFEGLQPNASALLAKNHRAMLVAAGQHDVGGLGMGMPSDERLWWAELASYLSESEAALLYGNISPVRLKLRRWYKDADLSRRVETRQDAIAPSERRLPNVYRSPLDTDAATSMARQTGAWLRDRKNDIDDTLISESARARRQRGGHGDSRYAELFDMTDDEPPPDNVTRFPDPTQRGRH